MRKTLACIVFILVINGSYSQDFEGIITYEVTMELINQETDSTLIALTNSFSSKQSDFYKSNHLKSVSIDPYKGGETISQFEPISKLNYAYESDNQDKAYFYNSSKNVSMDYKIIAVPSEQILGLECKGIRYKSDKIDVTYWYGDKYKIEVNRFQDNKSYYFSEFVRKTGQLPLKISIDVGFGQYNVLKAINVEEKELDFKIFELPDFKTLIEIQD